MEHLAIIGSGSGAFAVAIAARREGASVVMIEHGTLGGTCVNVGCIPSKALLAAAEARHIALDQRFPGIRSSADDVDMAALVDGKDGIVNALRKEKYEDLVQMYGFSVVRGHAQFRPGPELDVDGERVEADHYIIATGATPVIPPIPGLETVDFLTSTTVMGMRELPESIIVIGGNAVGLEFGQLFARLGASVTIVEALPRIAPFEEPEISEALTRVFSDDGITVHASERVDKITREDGHVVAWLAGAQRQLRASALLVATGRRPNAGDLGLDTVGVAVGERGEVVVDDRLQTANPRIWAIGDVTGHPQFVYVAGRHGTMVVDNALDNGQRRVDYRTLPRITFTSPAIASVGLTDESAVEQGLACTCRVVAFDQVPRAIVNRDTRGVAKIVAEEGSGKILGIHVLGDGAADAILAGVYAMEADFTVERLSTTWAPYLTTSEAIKLTAQSFFHDVATLSCCAA